MQGVGHAQSLKRTEGPEWAKADVIGEQGEQGSEEGRHGCRHRAHP